LTEAAKWDTESTVGDNSGVNGATPNSNAKEKHGGYERMLNETARRGRPVGTTDVTEDLR